MLILASTSPTRQTILKNAGIHFTPVPPNVDERKLAAQNPNWTVDDTPLKLATAKAVEVSLRHPDALVVGADQVLALGQKMFSKPLSPLHCRAQLLELKGQTHALISAISCARQGTTTWSFSDRALLTMRNFSNEFLDTYVEVLGTDCMTSVGGYKIEGLGLQLFEKINGDYFTILGLPLVPLLDHLRREGEIQK